jgi:hypothetical protein
LHVVDAFTGHVTHLPPTTFSNVSLYLHHVVLSVDDTSRSFELLVADMNKWFYRTFSSKDNNWSGIREVKRLVPHPNQLLDSLGSAVIGRTVYWPCHVNTLHYWEQILALDVDVGEATVMELPPGCSLTNNLLLARVRGRLCVLVMESHGIEMWTLTSAVAATGTWSWQLVISKVEIARQAGFVANPSTTFNLEAFGGRSGVVIVRLFNQGCYLLRLDLGTKEETPVVTSWLTTPEDQVSVKELFLHEVDLKSLLQAMKHF